ncbi:MAG: hypothetical protein QM687_08905 [Ferruginibacter sp.]
MLQPDEIITHKEWHELNAAEKEQLAGLAGSEAEFNLLKKMLQVSAEEKEAVPEVNPAVYQKLRAELPARKQSPRRLWIAAAAAIVIIASAALIFLKKEVPNGYVKETPAQPAKKDTAAQQDKLLVTETPGSTKKNNVTDTPAKNVIVQSKNKAILPANHPPQFALPDTSLQQLYAVQVTVASDPSLLNFISEAE